MFSISYGFSPIKRSPISGRGVRKSVSDSNEDLDYPSPRPWELTPSQTISVVDRTGHCYDGIQACDEEGVDSCGQDMTGPIWSDVVLMGVEACE